jgi:uncharacterized GH25 family protein
MYRNVLQYGGLNDCVNALDVESHMTTDFVSCHKVVSRVSCTRGLTLFRFVACVLAPLFVVTASAVGAETKAGAAEKRAWRAGQVMDVRVVNAQTKEPLSGVKVELQNAGPGINFRDVKVQTTDANGEVQLKLSDPPPTAVRVYPTKSGFVPLRVYWEGQPSPVMPKSITIPLEPGKPFGGTVQDEDGHPIPDVKVTVHYWSAGSGDDPQMRANIDASAKTDKDGRWRLDVMPGKIDKAELRVFVSHPGYVSDHLTPAHIPLPITEQPPLEQLFDRSVVMVMRKGETIEGRVVDADGKPVPDAEISNSDVYWFQPKRPIAKTNGEGHFRISNLKPRGNDPTSSQDSGELILTVQASGYAPELVDTSQLKSPLAILLKNGKSIRGRVVDMNGKAIKGATVSARSWRGHDNRVRLGSKSDAEGNFRLADVPLDDVQYDISKEGYMLVEHFVMSPSQNDYVVKMKSPLRVVGSVSDAESGKPLTRFSMTEGIDYDDGRGPEWMQHTTKKILDGRYEIKITQEGFSYRIRVEADGYMPGESRAFRAYDPDQGEVTHDFKLKKAAPLSGVVHDLDDVPLACADVYLATGQLGIEDREVSYPGTARHVKTDGEGRFKFPPEVEPFCLVAVHEQGVAMITEKEFKPSEPLALEEWADANSTLQISRRPARGQHVNFPPQPIPDR